MTDRDDLTGPYLDYPEFSRKSNRGDPERNDGYVYRDRHNRNSHYYYKEADTFTDPLPDQLR